MIGFGAGLFMFILWGAWWGKEIPVNLTKITYALIGGGVAGMGITEGSKIFNSGDKDSA